MKLGNPFNNKNKKGEEQKPKEKVPILTIVSDGDRWSLVDHHGTIPDLELVNILITAARDINERIINDSKNRKG
jgi:hypothetical protein